MKSRTLFTFMVAASLVLLSGTPVAAQRVADVSGVHFGVALNGSSIQLDDADFGDSSRENGGGLALLVGYNFTKSIGAFLSVTGASISDDGESYTLAHADLGGRFSFAGSSAFVPYLQLAFTGLAAEDEVEGETVEMSGTGFTGGAGFNYFFTPKLVLDLSFLYTKGEFNTIKIDGQSFSDDDGLGVNTSRFNIGIAIYP
jgi:opacity protein-like surface antigen